MWELRTKKRLATKQKEIGELKSFRKLADQQRKKQEYQAFKNIVKETFGEESYRKCIERMVEEIKAYNICSTAKVNYSRSDGKNFISINDL